MLRGVNKNIVEVVQTDNQYFERAILFVRSDYKEKDPEFLQNHAEAYLSSVVPPPAAGGVASAAAVKTKPKFLKLKTLLAKPKVWLAGASAMAAALLIANFM